MDYALHGHCRDNTGCDPQPYLSCYCHSLSLGSYDVDHEPKIAAKQRLDELLDSHGRARNPACPEFRSLRSYDPDVFLPKPFDAFLLSGTCPEVRRTHQCNRSNVPVLRAFWSLIDGTSGVLKGSSGVLVDSRQHDSQRDHDIGTKGTHAPTEMPAKFQVGVPQGGIELGYE